METRWSLIRSAAEGDERARSDFAHAYLPIVETYLRARWRNGPLSHFIDDATQDVFMTCLGDDALMGVSDGGAGRFRGWLHGVTKNIARRHEERRQRSAESEEDPGDCASKDQTLSILFDRSWARALIRAAAQRMRAEASDERQRLRIKILDLRFREGMPIREIAQELDLPARRIHKEYAAAREDFKTSLRQEVSAFGGRRPAEVERECMELLERL